MTSSDAESDESSGESSQDVVGLTPNVLEHSREMLMLILGTARYCFHTII